MGSSIKKKTNRKSSKTKSSNQRKSRSKAGRTTFHGASRLRFNKTRNNNKSKSKSRSRSRTRKTRNSNNNQKSDFALPEYKIQHRPGFADVKIYLNKNQEIIADGQTLSFMDGSVTMRTKMKGLIKGIRRKFAGESYFVNVFRGAGFVTLSNGILPGDILALHIPKDEEMRIAQGSFIAATGNISIQSRARIRGIFGDQGLFMTTAKAKDHDGMIWISSYGGIEKHIIPKNKDLLVNNSLFLASDRKVGFTLQKLGNIKAFILSGEGLAMRFKGPAVIYTQNRSALRLNDYIKAHSKRPVISTLNLDNPRNT